MLVEAVAHGDARRALETMPRMQRVHVFGALVKPSVPVIQRSAWVLLVNKIEQQEPANGHRHRSLKKQATAEGRLPVLFYRRDRDDWRAVWPVAVELAVQHACMWSGSEWTCEGSVAAWAAVAAATDCEVTA